MIKGDILTTSTLSDVGSSMMLLSSKLLEVDDDNSNMEEDGRLIIGQVLDLHKIILFLDSEVSSE